MKLVKQNLRWLLMNLMLVLGFGNVWGEDVTFTFNTSTGLSELGISLPSSGSGTDLSASTSYTRGDISMTVTHGSTNTRVWNSNGNYDLRMYKSGGSFTLSLSSGAITGISISGTTINTLSSNPGEYSSSNGTWTGSATSVTFTASATTRINTITVTYTSGGSGNSVSDPSVTPDFTFWPATTETASRTVTIAPVTSGSYVRYTTNGTEPTTTNGTRISASTNITISGTTTVKAIAYSGNSTSNVVSRTYTLGQTVNSIAAFKALGTGTEARLYLSPDNNARVLHASGSEIYVRDNTGAMCFYLATSLQNPVPQHDWHVAGWIIGKYQPYNGLPEFVATSNTTMDYLAIAAPVTETATEPVVISANDFDNYKADWVKISALRVERNGDNINVNDDDANTLKVYNKYNLNTSSYYQDPYDYALVDMTGLAVPYNSTKEIVPIYYNDARPIIYVIDENKEFWSPSVDIQNATVRLVRTLSNANWNTFCIPIYMENFEGSIRRYDHVEGNTMMFVDEYGGIEAGMPYLVKPIQTIENPVYSNVTLSSTAAKNIEAADNDKFKFMGIYSPENIFTEEKTQLFLKTDGNLYYPSSESAGRLKGMRAYFVAPAGSSGVKVMVDDDFSTMIEAIPDEIILDDADIYTISGQHVGNSLEGLPKGVYIVNGKKMLIK